MSYSTVNAVRQALFPFPAGYDGTNPPNPISNTPADLQNTQIQDAITEADSIVDAYITKYYLTPVAEVLASDGVTLVVPHPIDYFSRNIAAYNATLMYRMGLDFADTDPVARRYLATINALVAVSKGQVNLPIPDNNTGSAGTGAGQVLNKYVGDLWCPDDFSLRPINPAWPFWPDVPPGFGGTW